MIKTTNEIKKYIQDRILVSNTGCWEWTKSLTHNGYAQATIKNKNWKIHRLSYEIYKGEIPIGLCIDHLCENRKCINPDHLEAVTQKENVFRSNKTLAGINLRKTVCKNGHLFSGKNLKIYTKLDGRKMRICKTCVES